jgi:hypothetical protein
MGRVSKVSQQDREQAIILRAKGLTYKEVSMQLENRVTEAWCKLNLKSVADESNETLAKKEIKVLASRPEGVSYTEACVVLTKYGFGNTQVNEEEDEDTLYMVYKRIKLSLIGKFDDVLFRPLWIRPDDSMRSLKVLNTIADEMYQRLEGYVDDYVDQIYPNQVNTKGIRRSVVYEILQMISPIEGFDTVANRCEANSKLALKLRNRCGVIEPTLLTDLDKYKPNNKDEDLSHLPY